MTDWGLPNWRDASAYGDTKRWHLAQWQWEFLRSRQDVRVYFVEHGKQSYLDQLANDEQIRALLPALGAVFQNRMPKFDDPEYAFKLDEEAALKFGLTHLPNPAISRHPRYALLMYNGVPELGRAFPRMGKPTQLLVQPHQVGLAFSLDHPLEPQIESAKGLLRSLQSERHGKPLQKRRHPTKWLTYLRVLDGKEAGASLSEIAEILPATAGTDQTARDVWQQAHALCFNF